MSTTTPPPVGGNEILELLSAESVGALATDDPQHCSSPLVRGDGDQLNPRERKPAGPSSHSRGKVLHHSLRPARLIARWVRFVGPSGAYPGTLLSPARPVTASIPTDLEQVPAQVTVAPATTPVLAVVVEDPAATRVAAYPDPLPIVRVEELCGRQSDRS